MISKGADKEALKAVGAHCALNQKITYEQQFDVEEYMKKALKVSPEGS